MSMKYLWGLLLVLGCWLLPEAMVQAAIQYNPPPKVAKQKKKAAQKKRWRLKRKPERQQWEGWPWHAIVLELLFILICIGAAVALVWAIVISSFFWLGLVLFGMGVISLLFEATKGDPWPLVGSAAIVAALGCLLYGAVLGIALLWQIPLVLLLGLLSAMLLTLMESFAQGYFWLAMVWLILCVLAVALGFFLNIGWLWIAGLIGFAPFIIYLGYLLLALALS